MMNKLTRLLTVLLALSLIAAACGDDDDGETTDDTTTTTEATDDGGDGGDGDTTTTTEAMDDGEEPMDDAMALDFNGDGEVRIGIAAQGPRDDGGYYQALVDQAEELSADNGFAEPLVVENITSEEAATELDNLANQAVDIILVGASGLAGPLEDLAQQYEDLYWYCNCGAGWPESEFFSQTQDEGAGIHITAGVAFGEALKAAGGDSLAILGCCDLPFEKEMVLATTFGLQLVDPSYTVTYTETGNFPFDFDNVANATASFDAAVAGGADAIYPFLGGALEPVAQLAVDAGLIVANPGSIDACSRDIAYDIAVRFDGGSYVADVFPDIVAGTFPEGEVRVFDVPTRPDLVGAEFCDGTDEQVAALQDVYDRVASGEFDGDIGGIKGEAFS